MNNKIPNQLNFIVVSPVFSPIVGGVVALFNLAKIIHEYNIPCKIFDTSGQKLPNEIFDIYATESDINDRTIVVYPEVIAGNPLNANYVVRWILCEVGIHCSPDIYKTWSKDDFVYHYGAYNPEQSVSNYNLLAPIYLNPHLQNQGKSRDGYCHIIRKGSKFHKPLEYIHPHDSLLLADNLSQETLIHIFNTKEHLISYDPYSYVSIMAALCGCISIVAPLKNASKKKWFESLSTSEILKKYGEKELNGIAYGIEEIEYARNTLSGVRKQQELCIEYGNESVERFINDLNNIFGNEPGDLRNQSILKVSDVFYSDELSLARSGNNLKSIDTNSTVISSLIPDPSFPIETGDIPKSIKNLFAAIPQHRADQLQLSYDDFALVPSSLFLDYFRFLFTAPVDFRSRGEADKYYSYIYGWIDYLHTSIFNNFDDSFWQDVTSKFAQMANFIPVYFNEANLKDIYTKRADIIKLYLESNKCEVDYDFPARPVNRKKIRLGIIASHFNPSAETFAALPLYEYLSRDFEVVLYSFQQTNHPVEQYCRSSANFLVVLSQDLPEQVNAIRGDDLDILFFATNITAVTNQICLLATHRLARIQITSGGSVVTTGIANMDYFLSGTFTDPSPVAQEQYREELIQLPGAAHCFSYGDFEERSSITIDRQDLGITDDAVVFTSGANFYKITPELIHTWAKVIAAVPNSTIVLFPFGPNWSSSYPKETFEQHLHKIFAEYGVSADRVIALDPQPVPNREDLKEYYKLADVYLDSYPFAGTTSLIEPLQVNLPVIARQGNSFRSSMGAAMIRSLEITDLVADSEESYIQLAVALGNNPELRQQKSAEVKAKMADNPSFLDSKGYGAKIGELFKELVDQYSRNALSDNLRLKDVNLMVFPDWNQSEESVGLELQQVIQTLATQPDAQKTTLLIDTTNIAIEDAEMFLSSVAMNLMMEEDLDIMEELEISLIEDLNNIQWDNLLPRISARIVLECDNQEVVGKLSHEKLHQRQLESFIVS
jgi:predicted O-linked N-acetylglucosamine transferase (SPINDLY family)